MQKIRLREGSQLQMVKGNPVISAKEEACLVDIPITISGELKLGSNRPTPTERSRVALQKGPKARSHFHSSNQIASLGFSAIEDEFS